MFYVEIQFANRTDCAMFNTREKACDYAHGLLEMFNGEEMWFDNERQTYIVTVPTLEIAA